MLLSPAAWCGKIERLNRGLQHRNRCLSLQEIDWVPSAPSKELLDMDCSGAWLEWPVLLEWLPLLLLEAFEGRLDPTTIGEGCCTVLSKALSHFGLPPRNQPLRVLAEAKDTSSEPCG
mmetsp:Transcript_97965/g.168620  ORF Transcript_97965/g.168620 Transcript_97965/m.168620 type:complete len:118 (+) Transcript_97965:70-423(+)